MKPVRPTRASSGFTLVEVLVTLLIIGGIMMVMTQTLTAARHTRDVIHNTMESQLAGPAIMDLIERDVRAIAVYNRKPDQLLRIRDKVVGGEDADSLDFVTSTDSLGVWKMHDRVVRSNVNEVGYRLRENPEVKDLLEIYRRESIAVDEEPFDDGWYTFLHDRVRYFNVEVYAEDGPEAEPIDEWDPENEDQQGLPKRIEITLVLEMAPRLINDQLFGPDKLEVTYRRIIRLPESLHGILENQPVPRIPVLKAPTVGSTGGESE